MELTRSVQRTRRDSAYPVLAYLIALTACIPLGCHEASDVSNRNVSSAEERFVVVIASSIYMDSSTAILHRPAALRTLTRLRVIDATLLASKCALVTSDSSLASTIAIAFPAGLTLDSPESERHLLLSMMPPIYLQAPGRLELITFNDKGAINTCHTVTVDALTCSNSR
jgi:hypothetical protein